MTIQPNGTFRVRACELPHCTKSPHGPHGVMCAEHWSQVPHDLREEVALAWRPRYDEADAEDFKEAVYQATNRVHMEWYRQSVQAWRKPR